jgi:hypothetical protein
MFGNEKMQKLNLNKNSLEKIVAVIIYFDIYLIYQYELYFLLIFFSKLKLMLIKKKFITN